MHYNITYSDPEVGARVVTVDLAKSNSNIPLEDNNELYGLLLSAAVEDAENYIESSILKREVKIHLSEWQSLLELPIYPVQSIASVIYVDAAGENQTVSVADYLFYESKKTNKIKFNWQSEPTLKEGLEFPITITCIAGYENDKAPAGIKSAVLLRFSHKERFREDSAIPSSYNRSFYAVLRPYKRWI